MQGTWKEKISGWNHKDLRRKKQTRNHILKDKGRYFSHTENNKSSKIEKDMFFIYNKPVQKYKRWSFYNDGKRRKIAQKYANSKDRNNLRIWIDKADWESEIKTHHLSKSIAWEIH